MCGNLQIVFNFGILNIFMNVNNTFISLLYIPNTIICHTWKITIYMYRFQVENGTLYSQKHFVALNLTVKTRDESCITTYFGIFTILHFSNLVLYTILLSFVTIKRMSYIMIQCYAYSFEWHMISNKFQYHVGNCRSQN